MDTRIALIGIIVEDMSSAERMNNILHEYSQYVIGRMGVPHQSRNICVISIVVDAPSDIISAISGKIGMIKGISTKTIYSKMSANS